MKSKLILINWIFSFMGLSIDTEKSSFIAIMIMFLWFMISSLILIRAEKRGEFNHLKKENNGY